MECPGPSKSYHCRVDRRMSSHHWNRRNRDLRRGLYHLQDRLERTTSRAIWNNDLSSNEFDSSLWSRERLSTDHLKFLFQYEQHEEPVLAKSFCQAKDVAAPILFSPKETTTWFPTSFSQSAFRVLPRRGIIFLADSNSNYGANNMRGWLCFSNSIYFLRYLDQDSMMQTVLIVNSIQFFPNFRFASSSNPVVRENRAIRMSRTKNAKQFWSGKRLLGDSY